MSTTSSSPPSQGVQDLSLARLSLPFSPSALSSYLSSFHRLGSPSQRSSISSVLSSDPILFSLQKKRHFQSRKERLYGGLEMTKRLFELEEREGWSYVEFVMALQMLQETVGLNLHEVAFTPVIASQGSETQKSYWLPLCYSHSIIGCYAQTELGHGSNVQSLETTATYFKDTEEFEIDSPTITSTKFWIGGLGVIAGWALVQARLKIEEKDFGPHLFIVQIRDSETHSPMAGIEIGEIGPKVGGAMSAIDNGWVRFRKVRIPRDRMLSRFSRVEKDGRYVKPPVEKLNYGGMIFIRSQMISSLAVSLCKAVTISTRYLHVRRQFKTPSLSSPYDKGRDLETQVIRYPGVYMRLVPALCRAVVFLIVGKDMGDLYDEMSTSLSEGDTSLLAETHAISSGLKSYVSSSVVDSIEIVRRAMGGHGFLNVAGVGGLYGGVLPSVTYEGDNYILNPQVVRSALKSLRVYLSSPSPSSLSLPPSSSYLHSLSTPPTTPPTSWTSPTLLNSIINKIASLNVLRIHKLIESGKKFEELGWDCARVARAITESFISERVGRVVGCLEGGGEGDEWEKLGEGEREVMRDVFLLWQLSVVESSSSDLLEFGILTNAHRSPEGLTTFDELRSTLQSLSKSLAEISIGITDSFEFSDYDLGYPPLGDYDGDVYEKLMEYVKDTSEINLGSPDEKKLAYKRAYQVVMTRVTEVGYKL